jgi:hypothetical protein
MLSNAVFLDMAPHDSLIICNDRRFGGMHRFSHQGEKISEVETTLVVASN